MAKPSDPVTILRGVGPTKAKQLEQLGIRTLGDLLCHFPRGYDDRTRLVNIADLEAGQSACFKAMVMNSPRTAHIRKGLDITKVTVADASARLSLTFFNQKFTADQLTYDPIACFDKTVDGFENVRRFFGDLHDLGQHPFA